MLGRNKNNLCHQSNGTCVSPKSTDFDFWSDQRSDKYDHYGDIDLQTDDDRVEFQTQTLPLWKKTRNNNIRYEASPLLPYNHHYSFPSPTSRLQAIIDGRRELMEMIQDLPESSYELSLKDMVKEDDQISEGVRKDGATAEREQNLETKVKIKQKNKKNTGRGPIARCESMDSGVFLLKMFFPTSLGLKKKPKTKISRSPSFEGSEKMVRKDWWKMRFLVAGENKNSVRRVNESTSSSSRSSSSKSNSSTGSSSRSNSSKSNSSIGSSSRSSSSSSKSNSCSSRNAENNFTSRRWSFNTKKCKATGQPGCFF